MGWRHIQLPKKGWCLPLEGKILVWPLPAGALWNQWYKTLGGEARQYKHIAVLSSLAMFLWLVFNSYRSVPMSTAWMAASSHPCYLHPAFVTRLPVLSQPSSNLTQMSLVMAWTSRWQWAKAQTRALPTAGGRHQRGLVLCRASHIQFLSTFKYCLNADSVGYWETGLLRCLRGHSYKTSRHSP